MKDRTVIRSSESRKGGGLMIYVKEGIPYHQLHHALAQQDTTELCGLQLIISSRKRLNIWKCYPPPLRNTAAETRQQITHINLPKGNNSIIAGDVNARSPLWDNESPKDDRGQMLEEFIAQNNYVVVNSGEPTHHNRGTGKGSSPGITLAHSSMAGLMEVSVQNELGSDHLPVVAKVELECVKIEKKTRLVWQWKKADGHKYREKVDEQLRQEPQDTSIKQRNQATEDAILLAAKLSIPKKKIDSRKPTWWNAEIAEAIKTRNTLRKDIARKRNEWIGSCIKTKELINESKRRIWKEHVESLNPKDGSAKSWKLVHALEGNSRREDNSKILVKDGKEYITPVSKANLFAAQYADVSKLNLTREDRRVHADNCLQLREQRCEGQESKDFNMAELDKGIGTMKINKAGDPDGIAPRMITQLSPYAKTFLLETMNRSWSQGKVPAAWRIATIIPILKKDKPSEEIASYRPISLTSTVSKTMERMVADRMMHLLESTNKLNTHQAGFRSIHSTEDQNLRLSQSIHDGFQMKPSNRTILTLLDFSKAYDKVWGSGLIKKMLKLGLPLKMIRWIRGFLEDRRARVRSGDSLSKINDRIGSDDTSGACS